MFVYKQTEPGLYTVGHYHPGTSQWQADGDYEKADEAATRCRYLNGGDIGERDPASVEARALAAVERIAAALEAIGEIVETKRIRVEVTGP